MNIAILGLGLMGGSMGLSLQDDCYVDNVYGIDHNPEHQEKALELNLVNKIITMEELSKYDINIILLAVPVDAIIRIMKELSECDDINATIIDLGSSKKKIADNIPSNIRQNVVLAHPMTGTEYTGPKAALKGLYTEKVVALCDTQNSATEHNQVAISLFSSLRMRIIHMDSADHDLHAAYISHLPHIISFSLANTVLDHENRTSILDLAATGFRDMSRLAKSSPIMWEDIFRQNKNNLLHTLDEFEKNLKMFKENLKKDNWQEISQLMNNANTLHEVFK